MESPTIQENQLWTLDMNSEVLDSQDSVEKLRDQTVDDMVEDSVKDVVLDSDEEGNEVLSMTSGGLSLMETNRRNGEYSSEIDGGKHAPLGYMSGKMPGKAVYQGPVLASENGISGANVKIAPENGKIYADKDHQEWQSSEKVTRRSLAQNIRDEQTSAPTSCGTWEKLKDVPYASSHHKFPSTIYTDSRELPKSLEEDALKFVDQFVSVNDLPLSEKVEAGIAKGTNSPPTLRGKGVLTLMRRACSAAKAIKTGIFDWEEEETTKSNLVKEFDEHCDIRLLGEPSEKEDETIMLETFDIGFNTQMAAEAMEALLYAEPTNPRERHEVNDNNIYSSPETDLSKKIKSKFCSYQEMIGSNSEVTQRETEKEEASNKLHGSTSGSFEKQYRRRRKCTSLSSLKSRIIRKESRTANSCCELPVSMKKNMNGRYSRVFGLQKETETPQRHKLKEVLEFVECKSHEKDLRMSSGATKSLSSMSSPVNPKDPILSTKRKRNRKLELNASETKRKKCSEVQVPKKKGNRGKYTKFGADVSAEVANLKRTLHNNVSDLNGTTSALELDLWNYPKRKRTHRNVARHSNEDCKPCSWFPVNGQEDRIKYPTQNKKITKWMDGLEPLSKLKKQRSTRRHSVSLSKHKSEESSPGSGNCESTISNQKTALMELDERISARESCGIDGINSISSVVYLENCDLDAVMDDNKASETSKPHEDCRKLRKTILSKPSSMKELTRLGHNNSLPDFLPRQARRRNRETARVLFSQHLESNIINQQKRIIARLGFSVASCCSDATHFITDRFLRTRNMLLAMAYGKPVVTPSWLESCGRATYHIDEKYYILRDAKKEKEIGFSMSTSLSCAKQHPLLKGRRVFITPNIKPRKELIQSLVKAVQGEVIQRVSQKDDKIASNDVLILSSEEDYAACVPFLDKGAAVYDPELLLNGIVIQKLEFERHQLFTNHDENKDSKIGQKYT